MIHYQIHPVDLGGHYLAVQMQIDGHSTRGHQLWLPNWIPGSYLIRDFAKQVLKLSAVLADGQTVMVQQISKNRWQLPANDQPVTISYQIYAWDFSVRSAHCDHRHAFFNGTSVFLALADYEDQPVTVRLAPPAEPQGADWQVATGLTPIEINQSGFGVYQAKNYDQLIDHPVEMGVFELLNFTVLGVTHRVALTGGYAVNQQRLIEDLTKICQTVIEFFGDQAPPFEHYTFLLHVSENGYGGLEHQNSTALQCAWHELPAANLTAQQRPDSGYCNLLNLCCHEYFHSWWVKRVKPKAFVPYDLQRENYTELLWCFEGFTSYYQDVLLLRAGVIDQASYLALLARTATAVYSRAGRHQQSLSQSSFEAWSKFYQQHENSNNTIVSYYSKGALLALCLDLQLRASTKQQASLADLLRQLWQQYQHRREPYQGIERADIINVLKQLAPNSDLDQQLNHWVDSTEELPLAELLATVGLEFCLQIRKQETQQGDYLAQANQEQAETAHSVPLSLGVRLAAGFPAKVLSVAADGPAQQAGIASGDELIALDKQRVNKDNLALLLARYQPQQQVTLDFLRQGRLAQLSVTLMPGLPEIVYLRPLSSVNSAQENARTAWLMG